MKISKKEAITAYVLHLMMWGELAETGDGADWGAERMTDTYRHHHASFCEFCCISDEVSPEYASCSNCPSKVGGFRQRTSRCLGGLYLEWYTAGSEKQRKHYAAQIRDIELADWFKELIR